MEIKRTYVNQRTRACPCRPQCKGITHLFRIKLEEALKGDNAYTFFTTIYLRRKESGEYRGYLLFYGAYSEFSKHQNLGFSFKEAITNIKKLGHNKSAWNNY